MTVSASTSYQRVIISGEDPIGLSQSLTAPPYEFSIQIPAKITPRRYHLTAIGLIAAGQLDPSYPISIVVGRPDRPVALQVRPSILTLRIGEQGYLHVTGQFRDNTSADITESKQTTYVSNSPGIATVTNDGRVTAVAPGSTEIVIYGTHKVPVTVEAPVQVRPPSVPLHASQTQRFYPRLTTLSNQSVTWTIDPAVGGIDTTGLYTAPASIDTQQIVTVTATSAAENTQSGSATITLYPPVGISVSPLTTTIGASQTQQFTAKVTNTTYTIVNWSITPSGVGSIDTTGLYAAPASIPFQQSVTITATSISDQTKTATATVTLSP